MTQAMHAAECPARERYGTGEITASTDLAGPAPRASVPAALRPLPGFNLSGVFRARDAPRNANEQRNGPLESVEAVLEDQIR